MSKLVGKAVEDMVACCVASAVSGQNVVFIGKPGCGKTTVCEVVAEMIYGDKWNTITMNPSTPPEIIEGRPNMKRLLVDNEYEIVLDGTVFDPNAMHVNLDEISRANDPCWDTLLKPLSGRGLDGKRLPENEVKTFWLTENFVIEGDRTAALRDRVPLNYRYPDEEIDIHAAVGASLGAINHAYEVNNGLPTIDDILRVRGYVAEDNLDACKAVDDVIARLADEARNSSADVKFQITYRRVDQWTRVLYRYSAFLTGDPNFKSVPDKAMKVLQWMWPSKDDAEAAAWATVCAAIVDPIKTAIESLLEKSYEQGKNIMSGASSTAEKMRASIALGTVIADGKRELYDLARQMGAIDSDGNPTDERILKALIDLQSELGTRMASGLGG